MFPQTANDTPAHTEISRSQDSASPEPALNGYIQVRYRDNSTDKTFDCRRARLALKGKLGTLMRFKLQTELSGPSQKLLDAELMFPILQSVRFTAGQFKIPLSHENCLSSSELKTINRSQVVEALTARGKDVSGNQNGRDIGIKLTGEMIQFSDFRLIEYAIGLINGSGINTADRNTQKDMAGRIILHPSKNTGIGGSFYSGRFTPADARDRITDRDRQGVELTADISLLSVYSEYIRGKDASIKKEGWYIMTCIPLIQGKTEAVLRYDTFDPDIDISGNAQSFYTLGINFPMDKKSRLQVNYEIQTQESDKPGNGLYIQLQTGF